MDGALSGRLRRNWRKSSARPAPCAETRRSSPPLAQVPDLGAIHRRDRAHGGRIQRPAPPPQPAQAAGRQAYDAPEAWAAKFDASLQHKPTRASCAGLFMPAVLRTAKRGQGHAVESGLPGAGLMRRDVTTAARSASLRHPRSDIGYASHSLDGHFICDAQWKRATTSTSCPRRSCRSARKRVAARSKAAEQQIDLHCASWATRSASPFSPAGARAPFVVVVLHPEGFSLPLTPSLPPGSRSRKRPREPLLPSIRSATLRWLMGRLDAWDEDDGRWVQDYVASDDYEGLSRLRGARPDGHLRSPLSF